MSANAIWTIRDRNGTVTTVPDDPEARPPTYRSICPPTGA